MANATDTRIVQMQFDNKSFERNIKTSESSLERFKKALDFTSCEKGLDSFSKKTKNLGFDHLIDNVQKLADKFTGLGTVSEHILSQIRRGIDDVTRKISVMMSELTFKQIGAGKDKFEQLNKNVQTIIGATGRAEKEVYGVLERLNKYTDQTSYNFTDMAANIGKFTSVGIKLEDAEKEMEGIANWAARSGAGIQEASRAMYNLSQAMGVGKMTVIDWKSIENAGMATKEFKEQLIQAGLAIGTLELDNKGTIKTAKKLGKQVEVNYQNLRETLKKDWATKEALEIATLGYYYDDLYYEHEKGLKLTEKELKENDKLFEDHTLDTKEWEALEKKGYLTNELKQQLLDIAVAQRKLVKETDKNGKTIYKTLTRNGKQIEVTLENMSQSLEYSWLDRNLAGRVGLIEDLGEASYKAAQKCLTLKDVFNAWKDQLSTGWMNFWRKVFGDLSESMELFSAICNKVGEAFDHFTKLLVGDGEEIKGIFGAWGDAGGRNALWSLFVGEYDGLYEGAYGILDILGDIGKMFDNAFWLVVKALHPDITMSNDDWLANETYRTSYLGKSLVLATEKVQDFIQGIKDFMNEIPAGQTKTRFQQIQEVITGALSIAGIAYQTIHDIATFIITLLDQEHLGPAVDDIIAIFSMLGRELTKTASEAAQGKGLISFLRKLLDLFDKEAPLGKAVNNLAESIKNLIGMLIGVDSEESKTISLWQSICLALTKVAEIIAKVGAPIIDFFASLIDNARKLLSGEIDFTSFGKNIKKSLKTAINSIFKFTPDFTGSVKGIISSVKNVFKTGFSKEAIKELKDKVSKLFSDFKSHIPEGTKETLKTIYGKIKKYFEDTWNSIKTYFTGKWESIKNLFKPLLADIKNVFINGFSKESLTQLGDRIKSIFKSVGDSIPEGLKEGFKNTVKNVKKFFQEKWEQVFGSAAEATDAAKKNSLFDKIIAWIWEGVRKVKSFIASIFGSGSGKKGDRLGVRQIAGEIVKSDVGFGKVDEKGSIFDQIINWLSEGWKKVKKFALSLFTGASAEGVTEEVTAVAQEMASSNKNVAQAVKGVDLSTIALVIIGALGFAGLFMVIRRIFKFLKMLTDVGTEIARLPETLNKALKERSAKETFGDKMLKIAGAIGILCAAILIIGNMPLEKAVQGGAVVLVLMLALSGMMWALTRMFKGFTDTKALYAGIIGLIGIALAINILMAAIMPLAKITSFGQWASVFGGLIVVIGSFWAMSLLLQKTKFKWKNMSGLLAMAAAVWLLVRALMPFKDMTDPMQWVRIFGALGLVLIELLGFIVLVNKFGGGTKNLAGLAGLAAVVAAVSLLMLALLPLTLVSDEGLGRMMTTLFTTLLLLAAFTVVVSRLCKNTGLAGTVLGQLAALAAAIAVLVFALLPIALLNDDQVNRMTDTLGKILLMIGIFVVVISALNRFKMNAKGSGLAQLIAVAGTIILLVLALLPLALLKPEQLQQGLLGVIGLMTALMVFTIAVSTFGGIKGSGLAQLLAVAGAVMLLVLTMIPLALMDTNQLTQAVLSVLGLLMAMALVVFVLSKTTKATTALANMAVLLALAAVIYVFSVSINKVKDVPGDKITAFAKAIANLFVAFGAVLAVFTLINNPGAMIASMLVLVAGFALLMLAVAAIVPVIMSAISSGIENMMAKLAIVAVMFGDFSSNMENVSESGLDAAKRKFEKLIEIVMSVAGVGEYLYAANEFVTVIQRLGAGLSQFDMLTRGIPDPDTGFGMKTLNQILDMKEKFAGFSISDFPTKIQDLGSGLDAFANEDITTDEPNRWKLLKRFLDNIGIIQTFGSTDLKTASTSIQDLGGALSIFAKGATEAGDIEGGFDQKKVDSALEIMDAITTGINDKGGFQIPDLPDENEIGNFPSRLASLALALTEFTDACVGFKSDSTENALSALTFLGQLNTNLKEEDLSVALRFQAAGLTSDDVMSQFALNIRSLAKALYSFWFYTKDIGDTSKSEKTLTFFKTLSQDLTSDLIRKTLVFNGTGVNETTLGQFALDITALGGALANFAEKTHFPSDTQTTFKSAIDALDSVADIARKLPVIGGLKGIIEGNTESLSTMAKDIEECGAALALFSDNLSGNGANGKYDAELVKAGMESLKAFADMVVLFASGMDMQGIYNADTYFYDLAGLLTSINNLDEMGNIEGFTSISEGIVKFMKSIETASEKVGGFKDHALFESFANMAKGVAALINVDPSLDFTKVGSNIASGVKTGIEQGESDVVEATIKMVKEAIKAAKETADERSPSRVFAQIGEYLGAGLVIGVDDSIHDVKVASSAMAQATIDAMKDTLGIHSPSEEFRKMAVLSEMGYVEGMEPSPELLAEMEKYGTKFATTWNDATQKTMDDVAKQQEERHRKFNWLDALTPEWMRDVQKVRSFGSEINKWINDEERAAKASEILLENAKEYEHYADEIESEYQSPLHVDLDQLRSTIDVIKKIDPAMGGALSAYDKWLFDEDRLLKSTEIMLENSQKCIEAGFLDGDYDELTGLALTSLIESINDGSIFSQMFKDAGNNMGGFLIAGFVSFLRDNMFAEQGIFNPFAETKELGENIDNGLSEGIEDQQIGPIDAMRLLMRSLLEKAYMEADAHSPSLEFMKLGNFLCQGLALGIHNKTSEAEQAVLDLFGTIRLASEALSSEEYAPVIRPVLDLSGINEGRQQIANLFGNPYGLSSGMLTLDPSISGLYSNLVMPKDYSDSLNGIHNEIGELRGDLRVMADSVRQIKFVMSSGAIVGAIGPEMDAYLGQQGYFAVRSQIP